MICQYGKRKDEALRRYALGAFLNLQEIPISLKIGSDKERTTA